MGEIPIPTPGSKIASAVSKMHSVWISFHAFRYINSCKQSELWVDIYRYVLTRINARVYVYLHMELTPWNPFTTLKIKPVDNNPI